MAEGHGMTFRMFLALLHEGTAKVILCTDDPLLLTSKAPPFHTEGLLVKVS